MVQIRQFLLQAFHLMGVMLTDQQGPTIGVAKHMGMGGTTVARIQGHPNQVGDGRRLKKIRGLNGVVLQHAHSITGLQTHTEQAISKPYATLPRLRKGQTGFVVDDGLSTAVMLRRSAH
jgi:hypothetical protein